MNLVQYLPFGLGLDDVIGLLAGVSFLITATVVWQALLVRDPVAVRLKAMAARRAALRAEMLAPTVRNRRQLPRDGIVRNTVQRLNLRRSRAAGTARLKLERAGLRGKDAETLYLFCKFSLPLAAAVFAVLWLYVLKAMPLHEPMRLLAALGLVLLGALAPEIYLKNGADKRRAALVKGLPDSLDLLVICAEAGLSLDAALTRVAREIGISSPELADELGLTAVELTFLSDRAQALDNLNQRTNMPAIRGVVNTLQQTEKYGTPLAQSLRVLAAEFRDQRLMRAEEKAARLPAILTVPMIVFILPTLFVVLIGPAILQAIDAFQHVG